MLSGFATRYASVRLDDDKAVRRHGEGLTAVSVVPRPGCARY